MRIYSFMTTRGFRNEVEAKTAREAYRLACAKMKLLKRTQGSFGDVIKLYITFDKHGTQKSDWKTLK